MQQPMRKRIGFKKSQSDILRGNDAAMRWLCGADAPAEVLNNLPPKRERTAPRASVEPQERDIQRAIIDYLRLHPKVAFVGRFNSGAVQSSYNGHASYVRFNTLRGFPDLHGCMKGGRALYVEVKRPGNKATDEQAQFLAQATAAGALAFVATSIDDVIEALK